MKQRGRVGLTVVAVLITLIAGCAGKRIAQKEEAPPGNEVETPVKPGSEIGGVRRVPEPPPAPRQGEDGHRIEADGALGDRMSAAESETKTMLSAPSLAALPPAAWDERSSRGAKAQFARSDRATRPAEPAGSSYAGFGEPFDEVWVIQKPDRQVAPAGDAPASGELRTTVDDREIPLPLKHTDVRAAINGYIASVMVTQEYENPYGSKIEAVYVFPLPENAAVSDFIMRIGERRIRGIIREREEAVRVYTEARNQGYVASLLIQERPNVFTQKVANIEPGRRLDVEISYFHTLPYADGEYSFAFPMVVGPRYNPAGTTGGIGAVGRGSAGSSGQSTEVPYLRPGERSGHDIALSVDLNAGVTLEEIRSLTHAVDVERISPERARIRIQPADTIPNKDFVLRYRVAGRLVKTGLVAERDETGGYFTLVLQPPATLADLPRSGQELVFVIDTSGSMMGWPIDKTRKAVRRALQHLRPDDTFQIVRFANGFGTFAPLPVAATPENVRNGLAFLESLGAGGGTEMIQGIRGALDFPHDPERFRLVSFFTDGYVGNEDQILRAVAEKLGPSRIFSFGVGSSVNRYLIEGLARIGRGAVAYVTTRDSDVEAVDRFFDTIRHPALTDVEVEWGQWGLSEVYPQRIPDLFVGRPVTLVGRFRGETPGTVRVSGRVGLERRSYEVPVALDSLQSNDRGIAKIWARARIASLTDRMAAGEENLAGDVKETALTHGLLSAYTSFVAVDSTRRTEGASGTTVAVPVPVPEGVRYETTVRE